MSYINVIQISEEPVMDSLMEAENLYEDPAILERSDYIEETVEFDERLGRELQKELKDIATVDIEKRTITFLPKKTLRPKCIAWIQKTAKKYAQELKSVHRDVSHFHLRRRVDGFFGISALFRGTENYPYVRTSGQVIDSYLSGEISKKQYIGAVIRIHS